ncbi:MAG: Cdc6/Cdc18 family protein [Candidatus Nezhaarchaeales archaeon]
MSKIFADKSKLSPSYIPEKLLYREAQIRTLMKLLEIEGLGKSLYPKCIQVIGPTGSGKTSSCIKLGKIIEQKALDMGFSIRPVYVNLRLEGTSRFTIFKSMVEKVAFEVASRSLSPDEVLKQFIETLKARRLVALVIIDEVDFHVRKSKETVVYDLTRLSELVSGESPNVLGVIFIARDPDWVKLLDPAERSSLGNLRVMFPPYSKEQVVDILEYRASEALMPGAVSRDVLDFIADLAVQPPRSGDVRFALDMLLYSGVLAEDEGYDHITIDHVRSVYGKTLDAISLSDLEELTIEEKIVLLSAAKALSSLATPYIDISKLRKQLDVTLEELRIKAKIPIDKALKKLAEKGFIEVSGKKVGVLMGPLSKLISVLEDLTLRGVKN